MSVSLDFSGAPARRQPVPEGAYKVEITDVKPRTASTGTTGWNCRMEIMEGEHEGRAVFDTLWFTENAMGMVRDRLVAAGVIEEDATKVDLSPRDLLGAIVRVRVTHDDYGAKVTRWSPTPDGQPKKATKTKGDTPEGDDTPF